MQSKSVYKSYKLLCAMLLGMVYLSCNKPYQKHQHPEYFDKVISDAQKLFDSGNFSGALSYLDSSYAAFDNVGAYDLYRKYEMKCDLFSEREKIYDAALIYADSMLLVLRDISMQYPQDYIDAFSAKGFVLFSQGRYDEAIQTYYDGWKFGIQYSDPCSIAELTGNLASIFYAQGKYKEALVHYRQALSDISNCSDADYFRTFRLAWGYLDNIGIVYERLGKMDSAVHSYHKTLKFLDKNQHRVAEQHRYKQVVRAIVYGNLGGVLMQTGEYRTAEDFLSKSIQINYRKGYEIGDAQLTMVKLAELYLQTNRIHEAEIMIDSIRHSIDSIPHPEAELRLLRLKWKYHETLGNTNKAYNSFRDYTLLKDSFEKSKSELSGVNFYQMFDNITKAYQIDLLTKKNTLTKAYLIIALVLAVLGSVIIYLIWRNYKLSKKNLTELQELNTRITELNVFKDKILAIIAHDIRGPIAALSGFMSIDEQELTEEERDFAKADLIKQLNVVNELLDTLLRWASGAFHKGKQPLVKICDLSDMIRSTLVVLNSHLEEKQVKICNRLPEALWANVNQEQITIVFRNILANAIKFTRENGYIEISTMENDTHVEISIRDSGVGMKPEQMAKVFTNNYHSTFGTRGEKGIGLGLLLCKEYVEANKGNISIESEFEKGTCVKVVLPK